MSFMSFVSNNILLVSVIIVILFFLFRYLYSSDYFKNITKEPIKNETIEEKRERVKLLKEELKIKNLEEKINKVNKDKPKQNSFFDTDVYKDIGSPDDFFNTDVKKDVLKGGVI
jgi:ABC-type dipeptide/oligopeptide/nickel transport system permease component